MKHEHKVTINVDGDPVEVPQKNTTARMILEAAGLSVTERYLIEVDGNHKISYKDKLDEVIQGLHNDKVFLTGRLGPVTVSD